MRVARFRLAVCSSAVALIGMALLPAVCRGQTAAPAAFTLPNGLRVLVQTRRTSPLVAADLWVRAGAVEERDDEAGCAHFLEHTLFKGTTTRGPGETDIAIENLGASLHAATGPDYAHFYTTLAPQHLDAALPILADIARNATLPEAELERERGVILDELAQEEGDAVSTLIGRLYAQAFDAHPYRRSPGGSPDAIHGLSRPKLLAFYRRCYQPARCVLVLAGDVDAASARESATRAFGSWQSPLSPTSDAPPLVRHAVPLLPNAPPPARDTQWQGGRQSALGLAFHAPAASEADMAGAGLVMAAILGDRPDSGLLNSLPASPAGTVLTTRYTPRRDPSLFFITAVLPVSEARPETLSSEERAALVARLDALETSVLDRVRALQIAPPSAAEMARARARVLGVMQFEQETNTGLARAVGYAALVGGDDPNRLRQRVQRVTAGDVQRFAQLFFDPTRRVALRLLPAPSRSATRP